MAKVKLSDVIIRANTKVDKDNTDLIYYVGGEHFCSGDVTVDQKGLIAGSTIGPMFYYGFKAGQFLLVSRNPHLRKAGVVNFDGICSEKTFVLESADPQVLSPAYLPFVLQNERFWNYAVEHKHGSTNFFINWSTLANYEFELPELAEQERIARLAWAAQTLKKKYINQVKATDELVKSQFIEMFADTPKGKLSDIATITMGQSPDGKTYNNDGNGMCFYQGKTEFGDLYIGEATTWTTAPSRIAEANDVLMSVRAPVGSTNIATQTCCLGRGLAGIRPIEGKSTTMFILYSMRSIEDDIENMGVGSTFKAINKDVVYNLPIPLATIELQNKFVALAEQSDKSKFVVSNRNLSRCFLAKKIIFPPSL